MKLQRRLALLLAMTTLLSATTVWGNDLSVQESMINEWSQYGVLKGYTTGEMQLEQKVTRAELAVMLMRVFGLPTNEHDVVYTDVKVGAWYADAILEVSEAGIMQGEENRFRPQEPVTHQDLIQALAKAYSAEEVGIMLPVVPTENLKQEVTRQEVVTLLDQYTEKLYVNKGTYSEDIQGNVLINKADVVLKDMTIHGNLYIAQGVGEGDVTLENVTVTGQVMIQGGGIHSIHLKGETKVPKMMVNRVEGPVRVVTDATTEVGHTTIASQTKLEGKFEAVAITKNVTIEVAKDTQIENLAVVKEAEGTKIELAKGAVVKETHIEGALTIEGEGKIEKVVASEAVADKIEITVEVDKVENQNGESIKDQVPSLKPTNPSDNNSSDSNDDSGSEPVEKKYSISGNIRLDGQSVGGVEVNAVPYSYANGQKIYDYDRMLQTKSDANGNYAFKKLTKGTNYNVFAWYHTDEFDYPSQQIYIEKLQGEVVENLVLKKVPSIQFEVYKDDQPVYEEIQATITNITAGFSNETTIFDGISISGGYELGDQVEIAITDSHYKPQMYKVELTQPIKTKVRIELEEVGTVMPEDQEQAVDGVLEKIQSSQFMRIDEDGDNVLATLNQITQASKVGVELQLNRINGNSSHPMLEADGTIHYPQQQGEILEVVVGVSCGDVAKEKRVTIILEPLNANTNEGTLKVSPQTVVIAEGATVTLSITTESALFIQPENLDSAYVETETSNAFNIYTEVPKASEDRKTLSFEVTFKNVVAGGRTKFTVNGMWFEDGKSRSTEFIIVKKQ